MSSMVTETHHFTCVFTSPLKLRHAATSFLLSSIIRRLLLLEGNSRTRASSRDEILLCVCALPEVEASKLAATRVLSLQNIGSLCSGCCLQATVGRCSLWWGSTGPERVEDPSRLPL